MKNQKGFTIIEFVVITIILVIVVFLVIPYVTEIIKETRKKSFENEVNMKIKELKTQCIEGENQNFSVGEKNWGSIQKGNYNINYRCEIAVAFYDGMWCSVKDYQKEELVTRIIEDGDKCKLKPLPELTCQPECNQLGESLDLIIEAIFKNDFNQNELPSIFHDEAAFIRLGEHEKIKRSDGQSHRETMLVTLEINEKSIRLQQGEFYGFPLDLIGVVAEGAPYLIVVFYDEDFPDQENDRISEEAEKIRKEKAWIFTSVNGKIMCFKTQLIE